MYKKLALIIISIFTSACASIVVTPTSIPTPTSTVIPTVTPFTPLSKGTPLPLMYQPINPETASSVTLLARWNAGADMTKHLAFMQNGDKLLLDDELWHVMDGTLDSVLKEYPLEVNNNNPLVSYSPDGEFVVATHPGDVISAIRINDRKLPKNGYLYYYMDNILSEPVSSPENRDNVIGTTFSPDSRYLVILRNTGRIWFVPTDGLRAQILTIEEATSSYNSSDLSPELLIDVGGSPQEIAFSQDGSTMAIATDDHAVQIWDVPSLSYRLTIKNIDKSTNLALNPNGKIIAIGLADHQIGIWDTHSGQPLTRLQGHKGVLKSVAFSPNDLLLASVDDKEGVFIWGIQPHSNSPLAANTATGIAQHSSSSTSTPFPLPTPSPAPTSILTSTIYDFPSWMKNPNTVVFAALVDDDIKKIHKIYFFNVATGEKFEIPLASEDVRQLYWYDNMNLVLITEDEKTFYKFNLLQSGQMVIEHDFDTSTLWRSGFQSIGETYRAKWNSDMNAIKVNLASTGETIWDTSLSKNRYGTELLWSPTNESYMAFLQGSPDNLNGFLTKDMTLTIVDVAKGKILSTFDGNFGDLEWSPNGKMILYLNPEFRYRNYGIPFKDAPCILFWETGEKRCLRSIPRLIPAGYELLTTGRYSWADDSNSIFIPMFTLCHLNGIF